MLAALPEAIANRDAAALKALQADCAQVEAAESELANYAVELLSPARPPKGRLRRYPTSCSSWTRRAASARAAAKRPRCTASASRRRSPSRTRRARLASSAAMVAEMYGAVLRFLSDQDVASEQVLDERRRQIVKRQSRARKAHFRRVGSRQCAPENKAVYNQLLLCLERAGNECSNLVEHGAELSMWGDSRGRSPRATGERRSRLKRPQQRSTLELADGSINCNKGTGACADCARLPGALRKSGRIRKLCFTSIRQETAHANRYRQLERAAARGGRHHRPRPLLVLAGAGSARRATHVPRPREPHREPRRGSVGDPRHHVHEQGGRRDARTPGPTWWARAAAMWCRSTT